MPGQRVPRARELRHDSSRPEQICWKLLRDRRPNSVKFLRQHPIGPYFADFACISKKLASEVDGEHHAYRKEADQRRTAFMESHGWRVVRFWANKVRENPEGIRQAIEIELADPAPPLPSLSR